MTLSGTLNDLGQASLALSGAILGDPAGGVHPQLKQGIEEVTRLAGIAIDEAKSLPGVTATSAKSSATVSSIAKRGFDGDLLLLHLCHRSSKLHESNFI
jgi:hypothetical protein